MDSTCRMLAILVRCYRAYVAAGHRNAVNTGKCHGFVSDGAHKPPWSRELALLRLSENNDRVEGVRF